MEKKVSVIVPNYNNEKYLKECIESILQQDYPDLEVIVVDDCSTDHSKQVIEQLQQKYEGDIIRAVFLEKNEGVSHARNVGMTMAQGRYLTFLDADDYMADRSKLSNEIQMISQRGTKTQPLAAYSKVLHVDENGMEIADRSKRRAYNGKLFFKLLTTADTKIIPRDYCVETKIAKGIGGYREDMTLYEDYEFTLRISKVVEFVDTGMNGTAYRLKKNGLSDRSVRESDAVFFRIFKENIQRMPVWYKLCGYFIKIIGMTVKRAKTQIYGWVYGER